MRPRLAPPAPRRTLIAEWNRGAKMANIAPMAWQSIAARYMMAVERRRWLYPEVCVVVARQNGKTEIVVPRVLRGLEHGEKIMHSAQNRSLPRETFERVADLVPKSWLRKPTRTANGQERVMTWSGGEYRIVAPTRGGARGHPCDLVIADEAREFDTWEFVAAASPTLTASPNGQMLYLSNAGDEQSVVLNALRSRADSDPRLAYLEWSAAPFRDIDDRQGWHEANPALGVTIDIRTLERFRAQYAMHPSLFETEHLCRWVQSMMAKLVSEVAWLRGHGAIEEPLRPSMGVGLDPDARRLSAVIAWPQSDGTIALRSAAEITGEPVDVDAAARLLRVNALDVGVTGVGYSGKTDRDLARHFDDMGRHYTHNIDGAEYAAASARFAATVESGRLRWYDAAEVGSDLAYTVRHGLGPAFTAVSANTERPITAAQAAIRAVWLATNPREMVPTVH